MVVESALHKIIPYLRQWLHIMRKVPVIGVFLDRFGKWIVVANIFVYLIIIHCSIKILKNALNCFWSHENFRLSRCNTPKKKKKRNRAKKFCVWLWLIYINYQHYLCNIVSLIHQCYIKTHLLNCLSKGLNLHIFIFGVSFKDFQVAKKLNWFHWYHCEIYCLW